MRPQPPMTQIMKASEARQQFASVLNRVFRQEARVVVEKSGIPVAAIVSADDLRRLDRLDAQDREARDVLAAMRAPFREIPHGDIERETDRILEETRIAPRRTRQNPGAE